MARAKPPSRRDRAHTQDKRVAGERCGELCARSVHRPLDHARAEPHALERRCLLSLRALLLRANRDCAAVAVADGSWQTSSTEALPVVPRELRASRAARVRECEECRGPTMRP